MDQPSHTDSSKPPLQLAKIPQRPLRQREGGRLPSSVSIVGLGCSSFSTFFWSDEDWQKSSSSSSSSSWTVQDLDEQHPIVQEWIETVLYAVLEAGITLLDTAPWYGHGTSETVVGWALQRLKQRQQDSSGASWKRESICINTKVGRYEAMPLSKQFDFSYDTTVQSVQRSLQRLQCDYIDVLQLHDPEFAPTLDVLFQETIPAMLHCRDARQHCRALGLTGYPLAVQHLILQKSLETFPNVRVWDQALTYGHFNLHDTSLFDRTFVNTAAGGDDDKPQSFATYCEKLHHIPVLAAAPLSMGLLTPQGPPSWHPASPSLQEACRQAAQLCQDSGGVDICNVALLFALAEPRIPCTVLGMKSVAEVQAAQQTAQRLLVNNVKEGDRKTPLERLKEILTPEEFQVAEQILDPAKGPFSKIWADRGYADWDGVAQVRAFWRQLPEVACQEWQVN